MTYAYPYFGVTHDSKREQQAREARSIAARAILAGELVRQPCEHDKPWRPCVGVIHAHHDDYSKPLDVRWLCHFHHANLHGDERRRNVRAQFGDDSFIDGVWLLVNEEGLTDEEIAERLAFAIQKARA